MPVIPLITVVGYSPYNYISSTCKILKWQSYNNGCNLANFPKLWLKGVHILQCKKLIFLKNEFTTITSNDSWALPFWMQVFHWNKGAMQKYKLTNKYGLQYNLLMWRTSITIFGTTEIVKCRDLKIMIKVLENTYPIIYLITTQHFTEILECKATTNA